MSNATRVDNPYWVECISGPIDGFRIPQAQEPTFGAHIRVEYMHSAFSTPNGQITRKTERRIYIYQYIKSGKATPVFKL